MIVHENVLMAAMITNDITTVWIKGKEVESCNFKTFSTKYSCIPLKTI